MHAQPDLPLTSNGPPTPEDEDLRARLRRRNERIAKDYLRRMRALTPVEAKRTRTPRLNENDPRHAISAVVSGEGADLLVLGRCGQGGHRDLLIGSTAEFLVSCTTVPVLLVNCHATARSRRDAHAPRRPSSGPVLS